MYNFFNWYNKNRKEIWGILIAVLIIIGLIYYILTELIGSNTNNSSSDTEDITENLNNELNSITLTTDESVLTGDTISDGSEKLEIIDKFIEYCNNQDIESAYNLLSDECKDEMYQDLESFKTVYYDSVFNGTEKSVEIANWINDTYKVDFSIDLLTTGTYDTEEVIQDYITIVKNDDDEYKLNINGFIKRTYSSKSGECNGLTINVEEINTYMDYETYTFEIVNESGASVVLGDLDVEYTTYLTDENDVKYSAYLHELSSAQLNVSKGQTKELKIKYYSKYSSVKNIESIVFSGVTFKSDSEETSSKSINIDL